MIRAARIEDVIWRRVGDQIVVISSDGLSTHVLNSTAAFIWESCDGTCGVDKIAQSLSEEFDVSYEEALVDASEIIVELISKGIMKQVEGIFDR